MSSMININGQKIEERRGVFYINGNRVVNNCIDSTSKRASIFIAGFIFGAVFIVTLVEVASAL